MTFEILINGQARTVVIEPLADGGHDGRFRVRLDGDGMTVHLQPTDLGLSLLLDNRTVDAALTERRAGAWLVQLPHVAIEAVLDGRRSRRGTPAGLATDGEHRITAPMPGRVVRVLVKPGDRVSARQGLLVVEAMKMENELASPGAGTVREVAVAEGASVEAGRLLVVIEEAVE
jgi:biotin carboxyl carrier protein